MYFQPNSCNTHAEREWAQGTLLRQQRKVPPAQAQRVFNPTHHSLPFLVLFLAVRMDLVRKRCLGNLGLVSYCQKLPKTPVGCTFMRQN